MIRRALVLGAGGPAANGWEIGMVAGLADGGIDVRNADLIVGTSAGSRVAVQIASGRALEDLFAKQVEPHEPPAGPAPKVDFKKLKEDYVRAKEGGGGDRGFLQRMGALAMSASTPSESERRNEVAAQLPEKTWPEQQVFVVAVDAESGERRVFERSSGVDLVDAVAASGAAPGMSPTIAIGGRRYMDGGVYSTDNADLTAGCDRVLILALKSGVPQTCVVSLDVAVETLRSNGARVLVMHPDEAAEAAFKAAGGNILDPSVAQGAARAGRAQGRRVASGDIAELWQ